MVCDDTGSGSAGDPWFDRRLFCHACAGSNRQFDDNGDGGRHAVPSGQSGARLRQRLPIGDYVFRHDFAWRNNPGCSYAAYREPRAHVSARRHSTDRRQPLSSPETPAHLGHRALRPIELREAMPRGSKAVRRRRLVARQHPVAVRPLASFPVFQDAPTKPRILLCARALARFRLTFTKAVKSISTARIAAA